MDDFCISMLWVFLLWLYDVKREREDVCDVRRLDFCFNFFLCLVDLLNVWVVEFEKLIGCLCNLGVCVVVGFVLKEEGENLLGLRW